MLSDRVRGCPFWVSPVVFAPCVMVFGAKQEADGGERKKPTDHFAVWSNLSSEPQGLPRSGACLGNYACLKSFFKGN